MGYLIVLRHISQFVYFFANTIYRDAVTKNVTSVIKNILRGISAVCQSPVPASARSRRSPTVISAPLERSAVALLFDLSVGDSHVGTGRHTSKKSRAEVLIALLSNILMKQQNDHIHGVQYGSTLTLALFIT